MGRIALAKTTLSHYAYGITSAVVTNLAIIIGLFALPNQTKVQIVGQIFIIAIADNISDSFGMHVYKNADGDSSRGAWLSTLRNLGARFTISLVFVLIVYFFPMYQAILFSVIFGFAMLMILSYLIAKKNRRSVYTLVFEHLLIAFFVLISITVLSNFIF